MNYMDDGNCGHCTNLLRIFFESFFCFLPFLIATGLSVMQLLISIISGKICRFSDFNH